MTAETLNAILAIVAIGGAIGSSIAFLVARVELRGQRKETEELARLTSELEHKVHRLTINLDKKVYRLERVRDLINGLMHASVELRQQSRPHAEKLNSAVVRAMTFPELAGLIAVINDSSLTASYVRLKEIVGGEIWVPLWNDKPYDMGTIDELIIQQTECSGNMHQRILELLEEITQSEERL